MSDGFIIQGFNNFAHLATITVDVNNWIYNSSINAYTKTITPPSGVVITDKSIVFFAPPYNINNYEKQEADYSLLYSAENVNGNLKLYAIFVPQASFNITVAY